MCQKSETKNTAQKYKALIYHPHIGKAALIGYNNLALFQDYLIIDTEVLESETTSFLAYAKELGVLKHTPEQGYYFDLDWTSFLSLWNDFRAFEYSKIPFLEKMNIGQAKHISNTQVIITTCGARLAYLDKYKKNTCSPQPNFKLNKFKRLVSRIRAFLHSKKVRFRLLER